jgi:hypothetical protein
MPTAWQQQQTGSPYPRDTGVFFGEGFLPPVRRQARGLGGLGAQVGDRGADRSRRVVVRSLHGPTERALFPCEAREFGAATLGQYCDVDWRVKASAGGNSALSHRIHQAEAAQILENARTSSPRNLSILNSPQRLEYRFIRIRGHSDPFLRYTRHADRHASDITARQPLECGDGPKYMASPYYRYCSRFRAIAASLTSGLVRCTVATIAGSLFDPETNTLPHPN